ncbi:FAD-dependent monooxygenase [Kitasatospora sp. MAP5-34]|uniref:FAD-dependent oxidoreductase n=1 Tax=Kitasatospora sp. MAP5-34 TaxID=3035102 RepID=UPI002473FC0E|nr:FAD-dependent monooxygenase [Kitasatospora sp. MAP5-34]MDH6578848.1 2-polyprenyl-6-methoxyphenol hydroxylase-like FAD-dependent oxidoreductase [Kitasatospora sp. MAP5-34]
MTDRRWRRAAVVGGGICGLVAARVLADHFEEVVLLERDALPEGAEPRKGVPQARHVHGLLARGSGHLEELFPGLRDELLAAGAPLFDHGDMASTTVWAGTVPRTKVGVPAHAFSRDLLESTLRRRVAALPQVAVRDATPVEGLQWDATATRVDGVVLNRAATGTEVLPADLVVDASGRFSALPDWLEKAGYPRPRTTVVDAGLAYSTQVFEAPPQSFLGLQQMNSAPHNPRGTFVARVEGDRWVVTLFGAGGDHPPKDSDGWLEFAKGLGNPDLDGLIASGSAFSGVHHFSRTENRRTEYAKLARWPDRLIALGDSACAFNPVFGQGMTVAVLEALALGEALTRRRSRCGERGGELGGLARRFQRKVAGIVRLPWLMSISEDLVWHHYREGRTRLPLLLGASNWYKQRLVHLVVHDPQVFRTFLRVYHMLTPPTAMAAPRILAKALFRGVSPKKPQAARVSAGPDARQARR